MGSLFNFIAFECFLIVILGYYYYYICFKQILELHIERYVKCDLIFHNSITFIISVASPQFLSELEDT
jgi:hypothetical protein